jgi:hypothetical protein
MDRREELRLKLERIEREESAKQGRPPEQGEASVPSTEAASASMPPAPSLTTEQIQEITRSEIEKALREERAARQEESARTRTEARLDELSQELTDTNERVSTLREDTRNSLVPMAREIAELRSQQNSRALPPAREPRNVTPRPTPRPTTYLPLPSMYPPRPRPAEPETQAGTLERTIYQSPSTRSESSPPTVEPIYETEDPNPLLTAVLLLMGVMLLILAVWVIWAILTWAVLNPWMAGALALAALIFLIWVAAVCMTWAGDLKLPSIIIFLFGAAVITLGVMGYTAYQSLTESKPEIEMLGR